MKKFKLHVRKDNRKQDKVKRDDSHKTVYIDAVNHG
jgi:hypothetical protein